MSGVNLEGLDEGVGQAAIGFTPVTSSVGALERSGAAGPRVKSLRCRGVNRQGEDEGVRGKASVNRSPIACRRG
jgi:hypothetical protein